MANQNLLKIGDLAAKIKTSRPTVYRWISTQGFPRPVKLGGVAQQSSARWVEEEVDAWLALAVSRRVAA